MVFLIILRRYAASLTSFFDDDDFNHITPSPNWPVYQPPNLPVSTTTPLSEDETGAMNFSNWKEIGTDFLIKSNINNWISCSESGGSLVTQTEKQVIVPSLCEQVKPYRLVMQAFGPALYASNYYYYFETSVTTNWPVADPCGRSSTNQRNDINDPSGWIYLRPERTPNISVHHIHDTANPTGRFLHFEAAT